MDSGDLVWWKWNRSIGITMNLIDATLLHDKKFDILKCKSSYSKFNCQTLMIINDNNAVNYFSNKMAVIN